MPTVSIGFPVYNGENYLKEAMDSILSQSFRDFELIVSDNASTDRTMAICHSYADKDSRIRLYSNEKNMGAAWNFNRVFHLARGEYIQWVCHDDVLTPTLLYRCVEILRQMPEVVLCYSKTTFINEYGNPLSSAYGRPDLHIKGPHNRFRLFMKYHLYPNECSPVLGLFRAGVIKKTSLLGKYPSSDMVLLGEIALHGELYEIPECLLIRRDHPLKSTNAYTTMEERAIWFDPSQKGKIHLTTFRWVYEWLKSIIRSPIGVFEKIKCTKEVCNWARWNRENMKREFYHALTRVIFPTHKQAFLK